MARPSQTDQAELERLESMAALWSAVEYAWGVIALRFRQAERRAMGNAYLLRVLSPVADELDTLEADLQDMRDLITAILAAKQAERIRHNNGD